MIVPTTMVKSKRFHASGQGGREKAWACEALQTVDSPQLSLTFKVLSPPKSKQLQDGFHREDGSKHKVDPLFIHTRICTQGEVRL